jgi:Tol biopolymer transport system component
MMKTLVFFLCIFAICYGQPPKSEVYDYAFLRNENIYIHRVANNKTVRLMKGYDPCISPDGRMLAYTAYEKNENRHIEILDLNLRAGYRLPIDNTNYYGPVWSPDGKYIAFNIWNGTHWDIGVIGSDKRDFKIITGCMHSPEELCLSSWSRDSKWIIIHDLDSIFVLDVAGNLVQKYNVHEVTDNKVWASDARFLLTADKRYFIFDGESNDEGFYGDGPTMAVYLYDLTSRKVRRLSPVGYNCRYPCLTADGAILYEGVKFNAKTSNIFETDLLGEKPRIILKNAYFVSAGGK